MISVEFSKEKSSSTITRFHGCCSLFNVVIIKQIMWKGYCSYALGNTHKMIVFAQETVIIEVNTWIELKMYKEKSK